MSSNHKAPLAAFVVVAVACVVVLATSSMRSYARDAWHTMATPMVGGLRLVHLHPAAPSTTPQSITSDSAAPAAHAGGAPSRTSAPAASTHRAQQPDRGPARAGRSAVSLRTIHATLSHHVVTPKPTPVPAPVIVPPVPTPHPVAPPAWTQHPGHPVRPVHPGSPVGQHPGGRPDWSHDRHDGGPQHGGPAQPPAGQGLPAAAVAGAAHIHPGHAGAGRGSAQHAAFFGAGHGHGQPWSHGGSRGHH